MPRSPRTSPFTTLVAAGVAAILAIGALGASAKAQTAPDDPSTTTTSTTTGDGGGGLFPTTSTTVDQSTSTTVDGATTSTTKPGGTTSTTQPAGDGGKPKGSQGIPPDAQAQINAVVRSGPNNSQALLLATQQLRDLGMSEADIIKIGYGQFPIAGKASFVDDWLFPRYVPSFHLHQGTDVFAAFGTPIRAPFTGVLKQTDGAVGGLASYVTLPDGTYIYMAHMQSFAPGLVNGQVVQQGDVLGYVGDTGNARGGAPHAHTEIHPKGGPAVDPKATLDTWLANALLDIPRLVSQLRQAKGLEAPASVTGLPSQATAVDGSSTVVVATVAPSPVGPIADGGNGSLWASAANPAVGATHVASALASAAADDIDWGVAPAAGPDELAATPPPAVSAEQALVLAFTLLA